MAKITFLLAVLAFVVPAKATEYKLCASAENEIFCKWIEASRSEVTCVRVSDSVDCLLKMQKKEADFGTFSAEESFLAARFLGNAAVVLAEIRHPDRADRNFSFETVAVVKSNFFGGLSALKGLSYCHPGFSKAQYWSDRVLKDFEKKILEHFTDDIKCNSAIRSAYEDDLYRLSAVFGKACRPGTWAVSDWWDKKLKREYKMLCDQCDHPNTCSYEAHNKGKHSDALKCLTLRGGNVTYTALEYVQEYFGLNMEQEYFKPEHQNPARYDYLCEDGSTRPLLTSPDSCSWIKQPWPSVIALKSLGSEMSKNLKWWLEENEGQEKASIWSERLKSILGKGSGILKFRDEPITVSEYLKEGRSIPNADTETCRGAVRWCTISKVENKKCEYLSAAALIHGLPTQVRCVEGTSKIDCLKKIKNAEADVVYIDSDLGYVARRVFNLRTAAYVETQRTGNYYGVAVVKGDSIKQFKSLRGKKACFPMYNGLGWMTFIKALKDQQVIPEKSCSSARKAREFFSKACAPGVRDPKINLHWTKDYERLTRGCTNMTELSLEPTFSNPYFGEIGALKCLNNGHGDVAFLDFFAAKRFLESNRQKEDTNIKAEEFRILCRDGSIENFNLTNPDKCSYTQVNGGEVVTRQDLDQIVRNDIYLTLIELDDLFGTTSRHYNPVLKMFEPFDGEPNALFKMRFSNEKPHGCVCGRPCGLDANIKFQGLKLMQALLDLGNKLEVSVLKTQGVMIQRERTSIIYRAVFLESSVSLASVYQTQNTFVNNYVKLLQSFENCIGESSSSSLLPSALVLCFSMLSLYHFHL